MAKRSSTKSVYRPSDPKISAALKKAKELESKKLPKEEDIVKQDEEFKKDASGARKLLKPLWFLNVKKKKASSFFKK